MKLAKKFWNDERGLELSEYAVMIALIILVAAVTIGLVATNIDRIFGALNARLDAVK